ncbi:MAG: SOS response-associated peptidase family protein [Balneolales bacterium]
MCGRYVYKSTLKELEKNYGALPDGYFNPEPSYNVCPTDTMPIIMEPDPGHRIVSGYRWGLIPSWSKEIPNGRPMINECPIGTPAAIS